jgi:hypothetical protein
LKLIAIALALAACGSAPTCKQAFDKVAKATDTPLAQMGEAAAVCEKEGFSGDTRSCIARSTSLDELEKCVEKEPAFARLEMARRESELMRERAEKVAQDAIAAGREARDQVDKVRQNLDDLDRKVTNAVNAVAAAQNDADRAAARAKLVELQRHEADARALIEQAKAAAARAEHAKGVNVSKECLDNPLAAGCN